MYYLNLPLPIWKYLILVVICIILIIGFLIYRNENLNEYTRGLALWLVLLLVLNFANMYWTLSSYLKSIKVRGEQGDKGLPGLRGFRGTSFTCNQCGNAGKEIQEIYGSDVNDSNQVVSDPLLKPGKCVFPFVFNNEFVYECTTEPRVENAINDADTYGWCATSVNNDLTYKTFGYCKNSEIEKDRMRKNNNRASNLLKYQQSNFGITDIDVVSGINSRVQCPNGYVRDNTDLNMDADGSYIYLCKKAGLNDTGVTDIKITGGSCPAGYKRIDVNLNERSGGMPLYMCKKIGDKDFVKDIEFVVNGNCKAGYTALPQNLNEGAGGDVIKMCLNMDRLTRVIDTAFVYNDKIHFFIGENYATFNNERKELDSFKRISTKFGKLPANIDAAMVYPFDDEVYFFKGSQFWKYDKQTQRIAKGYPRKINQEWKGVPDNLDGIFIEKRKVYFVKGGLYFQYSHRNKKVKSGFPKNLDVKFPGAGKNPTAVFFWPYVNMTVLMQGADVNMYKNNKLTSDSPKMIKNVFPGLTE